MVVCGGNMGGAVDFVYGVALYYITCCCISLFCLKRVLIVFGRGGLVYVVRATILWVCRYCVDC